jgi:hypothetical protein
MPDWINLMLRFQTTGVPGMNEVETCFVKVKVVDVREISDEELAIQGDIGWLSGRQIHSRN